MSTIRNAYRSEGAFTAALLLAFGLFATTAALWFRLLS